MEKQHREEEEEPAPPYEESNITPRLEEKLSQRSQNSPTAQERAAVLRQERVKLLVDGHIEPLLETAILHGNSQTIIVVPSDAIETSIVLKIINLVHRPKTSSTHIVQLQGPNSTAPFWTQAKVVEELERAIDGVLYGASHPSQPSQPLAFPPRPADLSSPITAQKSWLKRTFSAPDPDHDPTGLTGEWKLGWRSEHANLQSSNIRDRGPSVRVKDIAFRMETELGLLTTTTGRCVVIELESVA